MNTEEKITDSFVWPWGIHSDKIITDVPAHHMFWVYYKTKYPRQDIKDYIDLNREKLLNQLTDKELEEVYTWAFCRLSMHMSREGLIQNLK